MTLLDTINRSLSQALAPGHRVPRASGCEAAEKYPTPVDCEVVIFDSDPKSNHFYIKITDANGGVRFARYKYEEDPIPKFEPEKYVTTDDLKSFKEDILNAIDSRLNPEFTNNDRNTRPNGSPKQSGRSNNEFRGSEADLQSSGQQH